MFILGILVFVFGIGFIVLVNSGYNTYIVTRTLIDFPNIITFVIILTSVIIATGNFKTFIASVNALLSKKYHISAADKEGGIRLFKLLGKTVIYATIFITVLSILLILYDLSDLAYLGPKISLSINSIIMGTSINLILINPAINILQTRYNTEEKPVVSEKQVIDKLLELCYKQGISPEDILDANEIYFKK